MSDSSIQQLNWGFISTAEIGNKNASGIKHTSNGILHTISSRTIDKANQFKTKHSFLHSTDNYNDVLYDSNIDIVYIPTPTTHREKYGILAAQQHKHILIEKPVASTAQSLYELINACIQNNVVLMDGVMFMHHPRLYYIRSLLSNQSIFGDIRTVHCSFTFPGMHDPDYINSNIRLDCRLEPLGALGDLAWYTIRFILFTYSYQTPINVTCNAVYYDRATNKYTYTAEHSRNELLGVMTELTCVLTFRNGSTGTFYCSFNNQFRQSAEINGTLQSIRMNDFVIPDHESYATFDIYRQIIDVAKGETRSDNKNNIVDHTVVTIKTKLPQHVLMMDTIQNLVLQLKHQQSIPSNHYGYIEFAAERFNDANVTIDADTDDQLQLLKNYEYTLINWSTMSYLTQCVCDAVIESSYNGGAPVIVQYKPIPNSI